MDVCHFVASRRGYGGGECRSTHVARRLGRTQQLDDTERQMTNHGLYWGDFHKHFEDLADQDLGNSSVGGAKFVGRGAGADRLSGLAPTRSVCH